MKPTSPSPILPIVMSIAGSDSSGGAGIQADLQTFRSFGVHGISVITAITSQNTRGVHALHTVPLEHIQYQLETAFSDFPISAVKIGMLTDEATVQLVARLLQKQKTTNIVLDPVINASLGGKLLTNDGLSKLISELIPQTRILTPNIPEAEQLTNRTLLAENDFDEAAQLLLQQGAECVVIKGGHGKDYQVIDRYYDKYQRLSLTHPRLTIEARGTGCTFAAATAAGLALKYTPLRAVEQAHVYVNACLSHAYQFTNDIYFLKHYEVNQ